MNTGASPGINDVDGSDDDRIDEDGSDPDATGSGADECAHSTEHTGTRAQWWLDPGLARLAFGSNSSQQRTGLDAGHLGLDLPQMLELDLSDPAQREFGDYELLRDDRPWRHGRGLSRAPALARSRGRDSSCCRRGLGLGANSSHASAARPSTPRCCSTPTSSSCTRSANSDGLIYLRDAAACAGAAWRSGSQQDGPLPPREAAQLLRTVAEAVDYAHRLGVLHLDLKPGNVLIDEARRAAGRRLRPGAAPGAAPACDNEHVSGTPSYMAPEQAQGTVPRCRRATDVWGAGRDAVRNADRQAAVRRRRRRSETLRLLQRRARCASPRGCTAPCPRTSRRSACKCLAKRSRRALPERTRTRRRPRSLPRRPCGQRASAQRRATHGALGAARAAARSGSRLALVALVRRRHRHLGAMAARRGQRRAGRTALRCAARAGDAAGDTRSVATTTPCPAWPPTWLPASAGDTGARRRNASGSGSRSRRIRG